MVPESPEGKLLTIILGVIGISLFGILLADCIGLWKKICVTLYRNLVDNPEDSDYTDGQARVAKKYNLGTNFVIKYCQKPSVITTKTQKIRVTKAR